MQYIPPGDPDCNPNGDYRLLSRWREDVCNDEPDNNQELVVPESGIHDHEVNKHQKNGQEERDYTERYPPGTI